MNFPDTAEHWHVALNHLPLIGVAASIIPLLAGAVLRQRPLVLTGLIMVVLFGGSTALVMNTGEEAEERFEHGEAAAQLDDVGEQWMHVHEDRAHLAAKIAYGTAAFALLAFILALAWRRSMLIVSILALLGAAGTVGAMAWVADAGGQIRHPEFRSGPPPTTPADHDDGQDGDNPHDDR
jgi:hypothetical protein